jgi:transcriptional regulator with XRE-family HTH domain
MSRLSPVQSKMARVALGWGVRDLAHTTKVASDTISRLERGEQLRDRTLDDIRAAFEAAGIEFLDDNGVRLTAKAAAPSGGNTPNPTRKPATPGKAAAPRAKKPTASDRQASPAQTKEAQIRALREQGANIRSEP